MSPSPRHVLRQFARVAVSVALAVVAFASGPAQPAAADSLAEVVSSRATGSLRVALEFGSVRVAAHPENVIRVEARARGLGGGGFHFDWTLPDDTGSDAAYTLVGRAEPWLDFMTGDPRVQVTVWVPSGFVVDVATTGGAVEISSVAGVVARTVDAPIRIDDIRGLVDASTRSSRRDFAARSRIEVRRVCGDVRVRTSGGGISLDAIGGRVDARAPAGTIEIDGVRTGASTWSSTPDPSQAPAAWCPATELAERSKHLVPLARRGL